MRAKTCRSCKTPFTPERPLQVTCSIPCAIDMARDIKAKRERKERKEAKAKLKTRRDWLREAQAVFNRFIRLRDAGRPCISCGRHHQGQNHAGHYRSTKAAPELRFDEANVHLQCQPCNTHLSGNVVEYRKELINRIGQAEVDRLEGPHEPMKYTIDDLRQIKATYQAKCKELESMNG